ncbi:MAG: hypothetical protein FWE80_04120 [Oscillospiraceae bacterium]|nr:hypothetical protein [Oscillospiraceae bacterium]
MRKNNMPGAPDEADEFMAEISELIQKDKDLSNFFNMPPPPSRMPDNIIKIPSQAAQPPAEPAITEKQLRALSRKHLLMMIFDLQEELNRVTQENEKMITAYRAGLAQGRQTG